jgi:hypothetical protein
MTTGIMLCCLVFAASADSDRQAIEQTIGYYFAASDNGDADALGRAFHPEAKMIFVRDGKLTQVTIPEWQDRIRKNPNPPVKANWRKVVSVDISGEAAVARVESDFATFQFIDYMSLLKVDGEWKIVNKIFHRKEK